MKKELKLYREQLIDEMILLGFDENEIWDYENEDLRYWIGVYGR
jgi:hypothetical protein